jgi:DNA-directed RNA polymerase subunit RPC12/RpoP
MKCSFCKRTVTKDQLRGKKGNRCAICTPNGVMPEKVKAPKKEAAPTEVAGPTTLTELNSMKKGDLVELAESLGSSTKGLKDDLVKRLAKKLKIKSKR